MALAKTVTYTPFNKTSFGFANNEIATAHPTLTNARVVITPATSTHWDTTGHISTNASGAAIPAYNKGNSTWTCEGSVTDVDAVLDVLDFFPADYEDIRTWVATALKTNVTNGSYINENPADTNPIPDTDLELKVYDPDNSYSLEGTYTITFDADQPTFGKQRPYWSIEPATEDFATTLHGTIEGGGIDVGVILQGADTDNIRIKCEYRVFGTATQYIGSAYGTFTAEDLMHINDKRPATSNNEDARFDFTGSLPEVQSYVDNLKYYRNGNEVAFDMYFTISNGVVAAEVTKTAYFSDATFTASTFPDQAATEETTFNFTLPSLTMTHPQEADTFSFTMTFDATGIDGIDTIGGSALAGSGIYTSPNFSSVELMRQGIQNTAIVFRGDFGSVPVGDDDFTFTIEYNSSNATVGSSYTTTPQTVNVTVTGVLEIQNLFSIQSWSEDTTYTWSSGTYPQILHGYNDNFECRILLNDLTAGAISATASGSGTVTWNSPNLEFVGTRDEVNAMLQTFKFIPNTDFDSNFLMGYYQKRVSGDTTSDAAEGDYYNIEIGVSNSISMNCTAHDEFSITQLTGVDWVVDNHVEFDSGLAITDLSYLNSDLPQYNTTYTAYCEMWDAAVEYTGAILSTNTPGSLTITGNGHGQTTPLTMTGTRDEVNAALADLNFQPDCDETDGPEIYYRIVRDFDTTDIVTVTTPNTRTEFNNSINIDFTYTLPADYTWTEETVKDFDCGVRVVDGAGENSGCAIFGTDYTATIQAYYYDGSVDQDLTTATWGTSSFGSATVTGNGKSGTPLVIDGTREDVNTALENLTMTPDRDWTDSPASNGKFYIYIDLLRNDDSLSILDGQATNTFTRFDAGTGTDEYVSSVAGMTYNEDTVTSLFSGKTIGILDNAEDVTSNVTYSVTITAGDGSEGEWNGTGSHIITLATDTKTNVNAAIQALQWDPTADYNSNFDVLYSQTRLVGGSSDSVHATNVNIGTVTGVAVPDFAYGTANSNIQYFVESLRNVGYDTTVADPIANGGVTLTPKQITLNQGYVYERPITVTDSYEDGGASQYKLVFSGGTLLAISGVSLFSRIGNVDLIDSGWQTKADLHTLIDEGLHVTGFTGNPDHTNPLTANFTLYRRTYTGTEAQIGQGQLSYQGRTSFKVFNEFGPYISNNWINNWQERIDNITGTLNLAIDYTPASPDNSPDKIVFKLPNSLDSCNTQSEVQTGEWSSTYGGITARILNATANPDEWSVFDSGEVATHHWPTHQGTTPLFVIEQQLRSTSATSNPSQSGHILYLDRETTNTGWSEQISVVAWTDWGVVMTVGLPVSSTALTMRVVG